MNPLLRFKQDDGTEFPNWTALTLGDIGRVASCGRVRPKDTHPTKQQNDDVPFFRIGSLGQEPDAFITREQFNELKRKHPYPPQGAILLSIARTIGKSITYHGEDAYYQNANIVWLEHDHTIDDEFLKHFYTVAKWPPLEGTATLHLYPRSIRATKIARPCLKEQHKIAAILTAMDEVIEKEEHELNALQEKRKAVSAALLHGTLRFSKTTKWPATKMQELFSLSVGRDIKPESYSPKQDADHPYPIYANTSTPDAVYGYANYYQHEGDTLTVTARGSVGHAITRHHKYVATGRLLVCTPKNKGEDCVDFFAHLLNHTSLKPEWSAVPQLTAAQLSSLKLQRPPRSEQQSIATAISTMEDVIAHEEAELSAWRTLKHGLLQHMFP